MPNNAEWVKNHAMAAINGLGEFGRWTALERTRYAEGVISCALVCGIITASEHIELRKKI